MTEYSKEKIDQIVERITKHPWTATGEDARKLARAWLMQTGRLRPPSKRRA